MSGGRTYRVVRAVMYFGVAVWIACRAGDAQASGVPLDGALLVMYAMSISALYLGFMCLRTATRRMANVVTRDLVLRWLQGSKAAPLDPPLAEVVKRIVLTRLMLMGGFYVAAGCAIWGANRLAASLEFPYVYYAVLMLAVVSVAQVAARRFGDV